MKPDRYFKNRSFKTWTSTVAFGIAAIVALSFVPASAATTVRDHRTPPVVRDHRDNAPIVRDHRANPQPPRTASQGGVTVTSRPRPVKCLGSLC